MVRPYGRNGATAAPAGRRRHRALAALAISAALQAGIGCGDDDPGEEGVFAYDAGRPLDAQEREHPRQPGIVDVRFTTFDGESVPAIFSAPGGQSPPYTCVIFQGGLGFELEQDVVAGHTLLLRLGYAAFSIQPRFGGDREVDGTDALDAGEDPELLERMLRGSVIDLRRALDYLEERGDCEAGVGYVGASFGGIMGTLLAGADDRIAAAALIVAPGDWRRLFECSDALLPRIEEHPARLRRALELLDPLNPGVWVGRIRPRPVLIVNARDDKYVCPSAARALQAAARRPKRTLWVPGGHGVFIHPVAGPRLASALADFLQDAL